MTRTFRSKTIFWCVGLILLVVLGGVLYMSMEHRQDAKLSDAEHMADETGRIVTRVRRHMLLPSDETPILGTVTDVDQLRMQQPFFAQASNGDWVLIYAKASKAIVYSEKYDRIVNAGPLYLNTSNNPTSTPGNP